MLRILGLLLALGYVSGCDFLGPGGDDGPPSGDVASPVFPVERDPETQDETGPELVPGTRDPSPNTAIARRERLDEETGRGYATRVRYLNDEGQDEFLVDNLAFDGNSIYTRGDPVTGVAQLGAFAVYEGVETTEDPVTGATLGSFSYRALYGRSTSGASEFAIVRSGSYLGYGFGGFVYQRNGFDDDGNEVALVLPEEGDAIYRGDYAGIRVFDGRRGLEYARGDAEMIVDFEEFNDGNRGVALFVRNRRLFDIDGTEVTSDYLDALARQHGDDSTAPRTLVRNTDTDGNPVLPTIVPVISPDDGDPNGELSGRVLEMAEFDNGDRLRAGEGTYYAIMSGEQADEIVGVLVMTGSDPRGPDTGFQETGGFIVYRN